MRWRLRPLSLRRGRWPLPAPKIDSELERRLRDSYMGGLDESWYREVETRIGGRVTRAMAVNRLSPQHSRRKSKLTSNVAALACACTIALALGGMVNLGRDASNTPVPPTKAPMTQHPSKQYSQAQLSFVGIVSARYAARAI
ncbi:MAG TPA: hypothetical protein VF221_19930 [Chloroflexota bacterium]